MNTIQHKSGTYEIKDISLEKREVLVYVSTFDTEDSDGDIIRKGAYTKTLSENANRIKHLFNHWDTCGVIKSIVEDNVGLLMHSRLGTHTLGNDVLAMYQDGIITEHSIGYNVVKSNRLQLNGKDVNELTEIRLWEGSSLDKWGANEFTPVVGVSDKAVKQYVDTLAKLSKALRSGSYSDETMKSFEVQLLQIQKFLNSLPQMEPGEPTPEADEPNRIDYNKLSKLFN
jgi:HK97 family phage prohead protease